MSAARRGDAGFTLVELLMTTAIIAVIVPAISAVLVVFYRTAHVASVRTDRAHDANLVASWLQPDLASASAVTVSGGCSNSLRLRWTERRPLPNGESLPTLEYTATYAVEAEASSAGPFVVRRTARTDGAVTGTNVVVHDLEDACDVTFAESGTPPRVTLVATPGDESGRAETAQLRVSGPLGSRS